MKLILVQLSPVYLGIKNGHISAWQRKLLVCKSRYMWEKNFMAKSLQSLFFYNCQILSIVQYLVVSLSQNGCIILILSIYLSQVSCLYFKYHRLLNSGCSFSGDLSLHASLKLVIVRLHDCNALNYWFLRDSRWLIRMLL